MPSGFAESTIAELAWQRKRGAAMRWSAWGAVVGALFGLVAFAPAAWLAHAVATATDQRLLLTDARGTIWSGSALPVLTGGPDSRDASALPDRLHWTTGLRGLALELRARQACCINGEMRFDLRPGLGRMLVTLLPTAGATGGAAAGGAPAAGIVGQWPAAWLAGLGTPWNTLQLSGSLRLTSPGLSVEWVQGRLRFAGEAQLTIAGAASRLSTLDTLGNYRITVRGDAASDNTAMLLDTLDGALRLTGQGQWAAGRLRFRGEARAEEGRENALDNLLNIIGRRQGAVAVITIG